VDLIAKFPVRGDVDNGELFILQFLFQIGGEKFFIKKSLTAQKSMQVLQLRSDIRQRGKSLHGFGYANSQDLHVFAVDWPRIGKIQTRSYSDGVFSDQKLFPVVQSSHGNCPERSVRNENQGVDG